MILDENEPQLGNFWRAFQPAPEIGLAEYAVRHIFNEKGRPFDHLAFPHMVACGGFTDSFDAAWIREIVKQWGSRLGKTFGVFCGSIYKADLAPCNQLLAGHVEDLALQNTERVREMAMQNPAFSGMGLEKTMKKRLQFGGTTIYAGWARSPGTLSNIDIQYGAASELDLWERIKTSKHPDPQEMFNDRFKDSDTSRIQIFESIPTLSGTYRDDKDIERPRSRIEAKRLTGSDCRFLVGCVHCGQYQLLTIDRVQKDGYACSHCDRIIAEEYRKQFIRSGVWCPRGCDVDSDLAQAAAEVRLRTLDEAAALSEHDESLSEVRSRLEWPGWANCNYITGTPDNDNEIASFQLSSLYALSLSWKRIHTVCSPEPRSQNVINQWLGETFEVEEEEEFDLETEAASLAAVITGELPRDTVPSWAESIILTCDRQGRTFPWQITAWDEEQARVQIMDAGEVISFDEVEVVLKRTWGNRRLSLALVDSGFMSHDTYAWCLRMSKKHKLKVWSVKGEKAAVVKHHYKLADVEDERGRKSKYRKIKRVHINTQSTQEWAVKLLRERKVVRLWKDESGRHQWICEQLLNEAEEVKQSTRKWNRYTEAKPNDQRDNLRYGFVGAQLAKQLKLSGRQAMAMSNTEDQSTTSEQDIRPVGPAKRPVLKLL